MTEEVVGAVLKAELARRLTVGLSETLDEQTRSMLSDPNYQEALESAVSDFFRKHQENLEPPKKQKRMYASVVEFVEEFITKMYPTSSVVTPNWTSRWWEHPQAITRLSALWQTFERLRVEQPATYMETFLRVHADYHMRYLMGDNGVFAQVRNTPEKPTPLPVEPLPTELREELGG